LAREGRRKSEEVFLGVKVMTTLFRVELKLAKHCQREGAKKEGVGLVGISTRPEGVRRVEARSA